MRQKDRNELISVTLTLRKTSTFRPFVTTLLNQIYFQARISDR